MKVHSIASRVNPNYFKRTENLTNLQKTNAVNSYSMGVQPLRMITFGGKKIDGQVALVSSESKQYGQSGGVSTVVFDYPKNVFGEGDKTPLIIPLYNAITLSQDGKKIESLDVLKKDGKPIYTDADLTKVGIDELENAATNPKAKNKFWELEEIVSKEMEWNGKKVPIGAYKVKGQPHYMIYSPIMAQMNKPYQRFFIKGNGGLSAYGSNSVAYGSDPVAYGSESVAYGSESVAYGSEPVAYGSVAYSSKSGGGAEYAQFSKALVELLPYMEKAGLNPQHLLLNDSQTAYVPEFIAQKAANGDTYYDDVKMSFVQHNLGDGYQQKTDSETMFRSFADNASIQAVEADPAYKKAIQTDIRRSAIAHVEKEDKETERYFRKLVRPFVRTDGEPAASIIPIRYAQKNNVSHISGVSELYVQDCIDNPEVAKGLTKYLQELSKIGKMSGILNGMNNPGIDPSKPIGIGGVYDKQVTDNLGNVHEAFITFNKDMPASEIIKIKKQNAANLIERLGKGVDKQYSIAHAKGKSVIGYLDKKWADKIRNGEDVTLFVSWGRADDQKGMDNVLEAFARFAKTPEGRNSVLVAGGELENMSSKRAIETKLKEMEKDEDLVGRYAYMNGFAPNAVLCSAGDAALLPSRFAPCELTDLEAMAFGTTPIVTNLQGLKQKNFDIRNPQEADRATGYKTDAHFYMKEEDVIKRSQDYADRKEAKIQEILKKYELDETSANRVIADKIFKKTPSFKILWREATDELTTQDLVKAMKAKVLESPETRAKLVKNAMNTKTGWQTNNQLHPGYPQVDKSSKDLYYERHINGASQPVKHSMFMDAMRSEMNKIKARGEGAKNVSFSGWQAKVTQATTEAVNFAKEYLQNKTHRLLVGDIIAAAAIVGGTIATVTALNNNKEQEKPHASARIA